MLHYEACVIVNAQIPEERVDGLIEKLSGVLTGGGANVSRTVKWGRRRLAHAIDKATEGGYVLFFFELPKTSPALFDAFDKACRYDENILRMMTVSLPVRKHGRDVTPIVPEPGWLAEFNMKLRPVGPRRREPRRYDRHDSAPAPAAAAEAAPAEAPAEAPAAEAPAES